MTASKLSRVHLEPTLFWVYSPFMIEHSSPGLEKVDPQRISAIAGGREDREATHPLLHRWWIAGASLFAAAFLFFLPHIVQDESYHAFADARTIWGVPNFWNVVSNLPLAIVGVLGLRKVCGPVAGVLFIGFLLTCFGSAYYHLAPSDARLVWDRLPMTLVFMSLLTWIVTEGRSRRSEVLILGSLVSSGIASVLWWQISGDLRPYALAQFGPLLLMLPALWYANGRRYLQAVLGLYALAKLAEFYDHPIYSVLPLSGHSWKHFLAALAGYYILRWRCDSAQTVMGGSGMS